MQLDKAFLSLTGLSVGDAFGEQFFLVPVPAPGSRTLPPGPWRWTDDTHMAISIVETLAEHGRIEQDALAKAFGRRYADQPWRGYASGAALLLSQVAGGGDWRDLAPKQFDGGSFGNGAAMRVAPVGAFFSGDPGRAAEEAELSAVVTHAHPEGVAGARAVAAAAAMASSDRSLAGNAFIQEVATHVPEGLVRDGLKSALDIAADDLRRAAAILGTGRRISAQDTVPFCIWVAAHNLADYEQAVWTTLRGLGDRDTTCAIVGGIVVLSAGDVPDEWLKRRETLPSVG
jgi:ADP-ribosylglycohydrolase